MFRKSEKVILHFLKDCAARVEYMMKLKSFEEIKNEVRSWSNLEKEKCGLYFLTTLGDLLFNINKNEDEEEEQAKEHEKKFLDRGADSDS